MANTSQISDHDEEIKDDSRANFDNRASTPVNHYEELGLTKEKTNFLTRILTELNFSLEKKKNSPLKKMITKNKSVSRRKQNASKHDDADGLFNEDYRPFRVEKMIPEPYFRYIPDRGSIQRLIWRAANMKDDLAEFNVD